ncbi:MAG: PilZ domain-containing protein [Terracidiphilus sp.]|jgi:c-di-GMP-binding flagellar brake protein YcgR
MGGKEHGECLAVQGREGRAHPRFSVDEDSVLVLVAHGMPVKARIVDLSLTGCRVRAYDRFSSKAGRSIEITFKTNGIDFRINGVVQWSDEHNYLGIRFVNMADRRKKDLADVIEEMSAAAAARAAALNKMLPQQQAACDSAEEMSARQPLDADAEHAGELAVAMQSHPQAAADPPIALPATPSELRGQPRPAVHRFATIILIKDGSRFRGRIVKLSLSGCRIRTEDRIPVGIYSRVETEFQLQGFPFRLGSVIETMYDRYTAGIHFFDLSERKRQQVLELMGELGEVHSPMAQTGASSTERQNLADGH